jgi:BolA protein
VEINYKDQAFMSASSPIKDQIIKKLQEKIGPQQLEVIDESSKHQGHAGHNPLGESHFEVRITADSFDGKSRLERHRMIYDALHDELADRVHALSIKAFTPVEVQNK